jgi:hypothetical protein
MSGLKQAQAGSKSIEVKPARSAREQRQFLELPYQLHKENRIWVAPLKIAQKDILNTRRHPFYKTADVEKFLAKREGRVVGRVMAIINHAHNEFHGERAGFFGFFEVENDFEVAKALLDAAREWLYSRSAEVIRGPVNPSTNYELGLLVEGFDEPPAVMMTYNPQYYVELIERYGFGKAVDMYAYAIDVKSFIVSQKLKRISVRSVNMKEFKSEVEIVRRIYNDAWSNNWGFVPVSEAEFDHLAKDMKQIVDPEIVFIAEQQIDEQGNKKPIGFFLAVPDINLALKRIKGRLLPFGLPKLWWHSRKISHMRIITMGIIKEHQNMGVASVFYNEIYRHSSSEGGYPSGEMSWVLENNVMMNRAAELIGGRRTKTYRIYELRMKN